MEEKLIFSLVLLSIITLSSGGPLFPPPTFPRIPNGPQPKTVIVLYEVPDVPEDVPENLESAHPSRPERFRRKGLLIKNYNFNYTPPETRPNELREPKDEYDDDDYGDDF